MNAGIDQRQPRDAIFGAACVQLLERLLLVRVVGNHQLARAPERNAVALAVLEEQTRAFDAVSRLQRPARIVEAGVNDLAVVRAGAQARARFAFQHADALAAAGNGQRRGQTDHAGAHDDACRWFPRDDWMNSQFRSHNSQFTKRCTMTKY